MTKNPRYISTEIIIKSKSQCDEIIREIVNDDTGYYCKEESEYWLHCISPLSKEDANLSIQDICSTIESLSPKAKQEWDDAFHREFYLGYEEISEDVTTFEKLELETLQKTISLNTNIGIAIYPYSPDDQV